MSRPIAHLVAAISLLPGLMVIFAMLTAILAPQLLVDPSGEGLSTFGAIYTWTARGVVGLTLATILGFGAHLMKNERVPSGRKLWWGLGLVLAPVVVLPFYWFRASGALRR